MKSANKVLRPTCFNRNGGCCGSAQSTRGALPEDRKGSDSLPHFIIKILLCMLLVWLQYRTQQQLGVLLWSLNILQLHLKKK